jgi:glucose/arabinose dehydrogenase/cytochrome c5
MKAGWQGVGGIALGVSGLAIAAGFMIGAPDKVARAATGESCNAGTGITLPPGFCATVFADDIGHARHLTVAADGTVYANAWSGQYFQGAPKAPAGGFVVAMRDTNGDGKADQIVRLGVTDAEGGTGGSGIALYKGFVYAELGDRIVRYPLKPGGLAVGAPETILSGMPLDGNHNMHPFVIDPKGQIFVDMGSATNACQVKDRQPGEPGAMPCTELLTRAGVWRYDANRTGQAFSAKERYATGIRNGEGYAFDAAGRLFVTQHGRDQLSQNWSKSYTAKQGEELPAEQFVEVKAGGDYGWPYCYYDQFQKRLVLAPEYGGDGKQAGLCAGKTPPVAAFPGHWAPNDLLFYTGTMFPAAYRGGAFVAFHGSWNRAPAPQQGYNIVFQPMASGKAAGAYTVFADGFAGARKDPGGATYRPGGLAIGPDGALYIADDVRGRIWRVTYKGPANAKVAAAPTPAVTAAAPEPARTASPPDLPPGVTQQQVSAGDKLFHETTCAGCHGPDGKGGPIGPSLASGTWEWGDGSIPALSETIAKGVPKPKHFSGAMPPMGGADLKPEDLDALAAYVWTLSHGAK